MWSQYVDFSGTDLRRGLSVCSCFRKVRTMHDTILKICFAAHTCEGDKARSGRAKRGLCGGGGSTGRLGISSAGVHLFCQCQGRTDGHNERTADGTERGHLVLPGLQIAVRSKTCNSLLLQGSAAAAVAAGFVQTPGEGELEALHWPVQALDKAAADFAPHPDSSDLLGIFCCHRLKAQNHTSLLISYICIQLTRPTCSKECCDSGKS